MQFAYPWTADDPTVTADSLFITADGGTLLLPPICVTAVSAGCYAGQYYNPGDVFLIASQNDYSDSTKNYELGGGEYAAGWMLLVSITTPLYQAQSVQPYPTYPAVDPLRRFVL